MFDRTVIMAENYNGDPIVNQSGLIGGGVLSVEHFFIILLVLALVSYMIGNISPSTILARAGGIDIKKEGSGNAGTTNALRTMGKKAAVITLVVDIVKGIVAVTMGWLCCGYPGAMICALFVALGHIWPVIYRFKGGKGVATSFGALLALDPLLALIELGIVAIVTLVSKRMSVGSVTGLILLPLVAFFRVPEFFRLSIVMAIVMIIKHRHNIARLFRGEEPKLSFLDRKKSEDSDSSVAQEEIDE